MLLFKSPLRSGGRLGADKKRLVTPRRGIVMPQGLGKKNPLRLGSLNIVLSPLLSQQRGTFDGRRQAAAECGGWSPLVRQLSAPQSLQSLRLLHVLREPSKPGTSAR